MSIDDFTFDENDVDKVQSYWKSFGFFENCNFYVQKGFHNTEVVYFMCIGMNIKDEPPVFPTILECLTWYKNNGLEEMTSQETFDIYGYKIDRYGRVFDPPQPIKFTYKFDRTKGLLVSEWDLQLYLPRSISKVENPCKEIDL